MSRKDKILLTLQTLTRWSLYAIIFFVPIYFAWFQENFSVFDLNKSIVFHFLLAIGGFAWLITVVIRGKIYYSGNKNLFFLSSALALLFLVCTALSIHPTISLWGSYERLQGLYNLWHYLGFFLLIVVTLKSEKDSKNFILALLLGSAIASLYGFIQLIGLDPLRWGEETNRLFSTFGQPNFFGHYLAVALPLTVYAIFFIGRNIYTRLFFSLLLVLQLICLLYTYSRGAWLAVLVTGALFFIWFLWQQGKKRLLFVLVIVGVVSIGSLFFLPTREVILKKTLENRLTVVNRFVSIFNSNTDLSTNKTRLLYWEAGVTAWREASFKRKLIGFGPDTQATIYVHYYEPTWAYSEQMNSFPDRAHNFVLDIVLQFGLLGFFIISSLFLYIIFNIYKKIKNEQVADDYWLGISLLSSFVIYTINNLFSFSLVGMNVVLYGLLGITLVVSNNYRMKEFSYSFFQPVSRWLIISALAVFFGVLLYQYNFKYYLADYYYFKAKKAEVRGECDEVLKNMDRVVQLYPLNQYYNRQYIHMGTNCFAGIEKASDFKDLGRALELQEEAIPEKERQFYTLIDTSHLYSIMGFYVDQKFYDQAEILYKQMLEINPYITTTYQDYGRMKLWQRKNEEAIIIFKKGIEVTPPVTLSTFRRKELLEQSAYFYTLIGMAYFDMGDTATAIDWYNQALAINPLQTAAYKNLSDTYYQLGDIKGAIESNMKAFRIDSNNSLWPYSLALLYKEEKNITTAKQYATQALDLSPGDEKVKSLIKELDQY